ncbi:MAG: hypothetical protein V3R40_02025 [Gammaproteobacteria bacterium]
MERFSDRGSPENKLNGIVRLRSGFTLTNVVCSQPRRRKMFGLQALDIALGLIVVYLILSLICTAANELIAGLFKLRARNLV